MFRVGTTIAIPRSLGSVVVKPMSMSGLLVMIAVASLIPRISPHVDVQLLAGASVMSVDRKKLHMLLLSAFRSLVFIAIAATVLTFVSLMVAVEFVLGPLR